MCPRYKIILEYIGKGFTGWQKLKYEVEKKPVQLVLEEALEKLHRQKIKVYGSSRTDCGVSSTFQVAHFNVDRRLSKTGVEQKLLTPEQLVKSLNYNVDGYPVRIMSVEEVSDTFNSRFDAESRTYLYKILSNVTIPKHLPLSLVDKVWAVPTKDLNITLMKEAAERVFLGRHDFSSFRSSKCTSNKSIRTINSINILSLEQPLELSYNNAFKNSNHQYLGIEINARAFLHNQVRIMVSCLVEIGKGNLTIDQLIHIRDSKNRNLAPATAPPEPLTLVNVQYPSS
ncbi:hypothetical protein DLAC_10208 [Tieghemostelium lacteum]|uniref:tRNA pseudouridine synthase n=1 Tax=Tieghemostelium lacteum TaxID=361077 RepID=A0A151Z4V1_TIELA|nr:hypothetical protein DLAC_10208 [Tieghemostelium lacteum]|eukprot:KYQ88992.1 hypothetical protein DLAC_10208 [Tieghemostelium lacteum]